MGIELTALSIIGSRPMRVQSPAADSAGQGEGLRVDWLTRLPSVEPGSISAAYRSFRAQEAMSGQSLAPAAPPVASTGSPAILSGSVPAALAAYRDITSNE